ncbi:hypothetical protein QBC35DRAFT_100273 [Podospora australis]|uniref:Uncharacterized protein n=1 Tax=Podospora australis TaxID=1536484 RepID=A0AAN6X3B8_9PEZI|nr:hypothetical protein QBC35DRAFT_100273 [Podospora australis]
MGSGLRMTVLVPSSAGEEWRERQQPFTPESIDELPEQCYAFFLNANDYPPADGRREKILAHFDVPEFLANQTCFELNGFFGSKPTYSDFKDPITNQPHVTSLTTWFRCLIKMVKKVPEDSHDDGPEYATGKKDYKWFETTVFTRWDYPKRNQILCIDVPHDISTNMAKLLSKQSCPPLDFRDPFALHSTLIDQLIVYSDVAVWRIRDPVRSLEKSRMRTGAIFSTIHDISRHAIHASEILEAAVDTLKELQRCRTAIHERLADDLEETYKAQARDYTQFQISLLKNLKLRSDSNRERLKNEINLAFNNLTRQDNSVLKSIALLTMIFLPATFISALFSTTFFAYGEDGGWEVSDKMWIYWATTIPSTIGIVIIWRLWIGYSDGIMGFVQARKNWCWKLWASRKEGRKESKLDAA